MRRPKKSEEEVDRQEAKDLVLIDAISDKYSYDVPDVAKRLGREELSVVQDIQRLRRDGRIQTSCEERHPRTIFIQTVGKARPAGRVDTRNWWM